MWPNELGVYDAAIAAFDGDGHLGPGGLFGLEYQGLLASISGSKTGPLKDTDERYWMQLGIDRCNAG